MGIFIGEPNSNGFSPYIIKSGLANIPGSVHPCLPLKQRSGASDLLQLNTRRHLKQ